MYFEKDFDKHSKKVIAFANNPQNNEESLKESLYYIACYALISDVRFPNNKKKMDDGHNLLMLETARKIRLLGDEAQAKSIENSIEKSKETKYSNVVHYTKIAANRLERMGDLDFNIYRINTEERFLLPDVGCIQIRERINNYINPYIQEVAIVGIPLTDKIFVFACSKKVGGTSSGITVINDIDSEIVKGINAEIFDSAFKTIVTSNLVILKKIVEEIKGA